MHVTSACPLRVASIVWQPRPDAFALTVVCKATFTLRPGESPLASAQEKPFKADGPTPPGRTAAAACARRAIWCPSSGAWTWS